MRQKGRKPDDASIPSTQQRDGSLSRSQCGLRARRELEVARFGFESLACSHGDFAGAATDLEVLAERLHRSAHNEWRGCVNEEGSELARSRQSALE